MDIDWIQIFLLMATAVARIPQGTNVPICILGLAMRIETNAFVAEMMKIIVALERLNAQTHTLMDKYIEIEEKVTETQKSAQRLWEDIQPVWDDSYNLCGDPKCDGTCMICSDGEYLGEDDYDEKYCRRGKR